MFKNKIKNPKPFELLFLFLFAFVVRNLEAKNILRFLSQNDQESSYSKSKTEISEVNLEMSVSCCSSERHFLFKSLYARLSIYTGCCCDIWAVFSMTMTVYVHVI